MSALTTCKDFISHPHLVEQKIYSINGEYKETKKGGCYVCRCASASEGINPIADELEFLGIKNEIHQTGGFTMCIYIKTGKKSYIYANAEGVSAFKNEEDYEGQSYWFDEHKNPYFKAWLIVEFMKEKRLKVYSQKNQLTEKEKN